MSGLPASVSTRPSSLRESVIFISWDDGLPGAVHPDDMANYSMEEK